MQSKNDPKVTTRLPLPQPLPMHQSPRCGAKTRGSFLCRAPAMPNGRCRMHGGKSTGAPTGNQNARKHGHYGQKAIEERRELRALIQGARELVEDITGD